MKAIDYIWNKGRKLLNWFMFGSGMNSIILPGITLGNYTTVGAGSIVTKSFPDGHIIIAGNPAKPIQPKTS